MSHVCDAYKCTTPVATGRFMCTHHWRMVPLVTQRTINSRFRALRTDYAFLSDAAYLKSCISAITVVAETEGHTPATGRTIGETSAYGRLLRVAEKKAGT